MLREREPMYPLKPVGTTSDLRTDTNLGKINNAIIFSEKVSKNKFD